MDIIIRNGVIQKKESEEIHEKKNEAGLLKKNWDDYINNSPGPYYDPKNCHLHVYRKPQLIKNFIGPQEPTLRKLITLPFNNNDTFCAICHHKFENKFIFLSNKKRLIDDDYYDYKKNPKYIYKMHKDKSTFYELITRYNKYRKMKLLYNIKYKQTFKSFIHKYLMLTKQHTLSNIKIDIEKHLITAKEINFKFYKLVYKLIKKPIIYPISIHKNLLLWPWELTDYQKLRLNNSEYKKSPIFFKTKKITSNYVIIE